MNKTQPPSYVSPEVIAARIFVARGHRIIIDLDNIDCIINLLK